MYVRAMPGLVTTTCLTVRDFENKIGMLLRSGVSITVENHNRGDSNRVSHYFDISEHKVRSRWSNDRSIEHYNNRGLAVNYITSVCFKTLDE